MLLGAIFERMPKKKPGCPKFVGEVGLPADQLIGNRENVSQVPADIAVAVNVGLAELQGVWPEQQCTQARGRVHLQRANRLVAPEIQLKTVPQAQSDASGQWCIGKLFGQPFQFRLDRVSFR
jgi:hypothetical protein